MAVNIHIKIDTIEGMSKVSGFEKQIQVESFGWGVKQTTNFKTSGGGGAGKADVADLQFTHLYDKASPNLFLSCCTAQHIPTAVLTCRKEGGSAPVDFLKVTLTDVIISSVAPSGSISSDTPTEIVTLAFASYKIEYQEQDNKGAKQGGPVEVKYSVQENKKL